MDRKFKETIMTFLPFKVNNGFKSYLYRSWDMSINRMRVRR